MTPSLARRYALAVAGLEAGGGLSGLLLGEPHFTGPTYAPARRVLTFMPGDPFVWWCWLLIALSTAAIVALMSRHDLSIRLAFSGLCGFWAFWAVIYFAAYTNPAAGPFASWLALIAFVGNSRPVVTPALRCD